MIVCSCWRNFTQKQTAMKKMLATTLFLLTCQLLLAQDHTDEAAINKQVDAMIYSWNHHNYDDLKNYTTENTDWVNVVGGKDEKNHNMRTRFIIIQCLKLRYVKKSLLPSAL